MHHHRRHHGRLRFHRPFPNRQELLTRLESYQRDLEQELADVSDLIRRLQAGEQPGPAPGQAEPQSV